MHNRKVDVFVMKYACILSLILVRSALGREKEEYAKQEEWEKEKKDASLLSEPTKERKKLA